MTSPAHTLLAGLEKVKAVVPAEDTFMHKAIDISVDALRAALATKLTPPIECESQKTVDAYVTRRLAEHFTRTEQTLLKLQMHLYAQAIQNDTPFPPIKTEAEAEAEVENVSS